VLEAVVTDLLRAAVLVAEEMAAQLLWLAKQELLTPAEAVAHPDLAMAQDQQAAPAS
jgi:hypothetical protein